MTRIAPLVALALGALPALAATADGASTAGPATQKAAGPARPAQPAAAPEGVAIPPELAAMAAKMQSVRTLTARVRQEKELSALAEVVRNDGSFAFERPRRLAMDFDGPGGTRLVIDGDQMTMQYKGLGKVERTQLSRDPRARAVAEHLFLLLDADPPSLAEVYGLTVVGKRPLRVRLTPKAEALRQILAHVDAEIDERGFVSTLAIVEANGDRTVWRFESPAVNAAVPPERFAVPPG